MKAVLLLLTLSGLATAGLRGGVKGFLEKAGIWPGDRLDISIHGVPRSEEAHRGALVAGFQNS